MHCLHLKKLNGTNETANVHEIVSQEYDQITEKQEQFLYFFIYKADISSFFWVIRVKWKIEQNISMRGYLDMTWILYLKSNVNVWKKKIQAKVLDSSAA